jgi:hypothetical protein
MQSADSARLVLLLLILCIHATRASACMCGSAYHGKTPWELAKLEAKGAPAIFEGVPVRFKMRWGMLDAKDGEMVPADFPGEKADDWPQMVVTFRVQKIYKGNFGAEVEIVTGLGGGDCGARYLPGLRIWSTGLKRTSMPCIQACAPRGAGSAAATFLRICGT